VINYRQQGLAEKICKTHQIVLAKRSKDRVRSTKWLGWDLCVKGGILLGGYLQIYQDTRINIRVNYIYLQRSKHKRGTSSTTSVQGYRDFLAFEGANDSGDVDG
jgi:hypothetical protein